jgi:trigger factor
MNELQISVEVRDGLERCLKIEVPAAQVDVAVKSRLHSLGKTAKLKGFRPGKVPQKVIAQNYGAQVRQEVLQEQVESSFSEAISRENLRPVDAPKIELVNVAAGENLAYTALIEIYPEFDVDGLESFKIEQLETSIGEADIDAMVETLRQQKRVWSAVERKSADGDQVTIDFKGDLAGEPLEGGSGESVPVVIGQGQMLEDFEKSLLGLSSGDENTFDVTFPKDYHAADLAEKKATFTAKIHEVAEQTLPVIDEEFIKSFGVASGEMDEFRQDVQRNMDREVVARTRAEVKRQAMEQLLEANPITVPGALVEREAGSLRAESMRNLGISDPEDPQAPDLEAFRETAERRVRLGLLVARIIDKHQLKVDRARVEEKVDEICAPYDQPDEIKKLYLQNAQMLEQIEGLILEEQVLDLLVSKANVGTKSIAFHDLMTIEA